MNDAERILREEIRAWLRAREMTPAETETEIVEDTPKRFEVVTPTGSFVARGDQIVNPESQAETQPARKPRGQKSRVKVGEVSNNRTVLARMPGNRLRIQCTACHAVSITQPTNWRRHGCKRCSDASRDRRTLTLDGINTHLALVREEIAAKMRASGIVATAPATAPEIARRFKMESDPRVVGRALARGDDDALKVERLNGSGQFVLRTSS